MSEYNCCDNPEVGYEHGETICANCGSVGVEKKDENNEFEEEIFNLVGVKNKEVRMAEDGPKLYLERYDGTVVPVDISMETYEALERTFMLTDKLDE